jgi:L-aminoadipate-semialdehyde dehydrogenase
LLERENVHVIAHVRGTQGVPAALERIQKSLRGYGVWQDSWATRLNAVIGDLTQPHLGLDDDTWKIIRDSVDVVTHNGALVHWVKQYKHVERSNVLSTIDALRLCNQGKPKLFSFVSSTTRTTTSTCHKKKTSTGLGAVMEADDMTGSRTGLGTGYGPSKCGVSSLPRPLSALGKMHPDGPQGRALPAFKAGAVEAQAKYGVGGRDGVNTSAPPS